MHTLESRYQSTDFFLNSDFQETHVKIVWEKKRFFYARFKAFHINNVNIYFPAMPQQIWNWCIFYWSQYLESIFQSDHRTNFLIDFHFIFLTFQFHSLAIRTLRCRFRKRNHRRMWDWNCGRGRRMLWSFWRPEGRIIVCWAWVKGGLSFIWRLRSMKPRYSLAF